MTCKFTFDSLRALEARLEKANAPNPRRLLAEAGQVSLDCLRNYMNGVCSVSLDRYRCMEIAVRLVEEGKLPTLLRDKPPELKLPRFIHAIYSKRKGVRYLLGFRAAVNNETNQLDSKSFTIQRYGGYDEALAAAVRYVERELGKNFDLPPKFIYANYQKHVKVRENLSGYRAAKKNCFDRYFSVKDYGGQEKAYQAAVEFVKSQLQ